MLIYYDKIEKYIFWNLNINFVVLKFIMKTKILFPVSIIIIASILLVFIFSNLGGSLKQVAEKTAPTTIPKNIEIITNTNNWLTFKDSLYKFQVMYPATWTVTKDPKLAGGKYSLFWTAEKPAKGLATANSLLVFQPVAGHTLLKSWIDGTKGTDYVPTFEDQEITYTNNNSKAVIKQCKSTCNYYVYQEINDNTYTIVVSTEMENDALVDTISSTLKESK